MRISESWFLAYLVNSIWQIPLIYLVTWLVACTVRRFGAVTEHKLWVSALALMVSLPAIAFPVASFTQMLRNFSRLSLVHGLPHRRPQITVVMGSGYVHGSLGFPEKLITALTAVYLLAILYCACKLFVGLWKTQRLKSHSRTHVPQAIDEARWSRYKTIFNVPEAEFAVSNELCGPVALGVFRKLMLLPANLDATLSEEDMNSAIAHEAAHLQRNDFAKNLLYQLVSLPIAYHPLLHLTLGHIAETREMICDSLAAEAVAGPEKFARSLLRLASSMMSVTSNSTIHAIGIFDANTLERRIMSLTTKRREIRVAQRVAVWAIYAAIASVTCASAMALRMNVYAPMGHGQELPPPTPNGPVHISGGVIAGTIVSKVQPIYPDIAKAAKVEGAVVLHAVIGTDGQIQSLQVISGTPMLVAASMEAVRQWVYKPYLLNGVPTMVDTTITVNFNLNPDSE